jgi:hypothetical protein
VRAPGIETARTADLLRVTLEQDHLQEHTQI